jgi:hypothetical protein
MSKSKGYFYQTSTEVIIKGKKYRVAKSDAWIFNNKKNKKSK